MISPTNNLKIVCYQLLQYVNMLIGYYQCLVTFKRCKMNQLILTMKATLFILLCLVFNPIQASNPGPAVLATKGGIWPRPQQLNTTDQYFILKPDTFVFTVSYYLNKLTGTKLRYFR